MAGARVEENVAKPRTLHVEVEEAKAEFNTCNTTVRRGTITEGNGDDGSELYAGLSRESEGECIERQALAARLRVLWLRGFARPGDDTDEDLEDMLGSPVAAAPVGKLRMVLGILEKRAPDGGSGACPPPR